MTSRTTTRRPFLLASTLALGLLAGCSSSPRPAAEAPPAESGGTPPSRASAPAETPPAAPAPTNDSPGDTSGGTATAAGKSAVYVVQDSGVRCIAAPCPSLVARLVDGPKDAEGIPITDLDLSTLGLSDEQKGRVLSSTQKDGPGLKVEASVVTQAKAGPAGASTVLRVNRVLEGR